MPFRKSLVLAPIAVVGASFLLLTGCPSRTPAHPWASAKGRPKVLVSFAPLHSFAANVAGDDADVKCLLTTSGPHTHGDATPRQIDLARGCDVFIINGLGLEDEADGIATKLKRVAANSNWNVLDLGSKIPERDLMEGECHHDGADGHEGHEHGNDPHVWLGIKHVRIMVAAIRDELKRLDPAHAAGYDDRAAAYLKKLDRLEADGRAMFANKPDNEKSILSFHESLNYFGECYGLRIVGSIEVTPGKEPTDAKLKEIIKKCQNKKVRVIAVEPQFPSHSSAKIILNALRGSAQQPIDAVFAEVNPLETCDEKDLGPDLYEKTMRTNLEALAAALR